MASIVYPHFTVRSTALKTLQNKIDNFLPILMADFVFMVKFIVKNRTSYHISLNNLIDFMNTYPLKPIMILKALLESRKSN